MERVLRQAFFDAQTRFEGSKNNVESEAASGMMTYILAKSLPEPAGSQMRQHFKRYANRVLDHEWETMTQGRMDEVARDELIVNLARNPVLPGGEGYGNPYAGEIKISKTSFQPLRECVVNDR